MKFLSILAIGLLAGWQALACTSFEFGNSQQGGLAHNFDWFDKMGYTAAYFVNARGTSKDGLNLFNSDPVAHWTSKYGSVTYSLVGREFPVGGQNEKGLVIHAQQAPVAQYPTGSLPVMDALQWMQYLLDTSATVPEALQNAALVRPVSSLVLHFFICDASSACAVVEFINGAMVSYSGSSLNVPALTNSDYPTSVSTWQGCPSSGDCKLSDNSLERFTEAASLSANYSAQDPLQYAMDGLTEVAQSHGVFTRYHFYNPAQAVGTIYFSGGLQPAWQSIDISQLDYSCAGAGKYFEVDLNGTGDQTAKFIPFDIAEQQKLVAQVPAKPEWVPLLVNYPSTTTCQ